MSSYSSLVRQTQPAVEPVTLSEAKAHLRVDTADDDVLIQGLVRAAREWVEEYLDRTLVHTQWAMRLEEFPEEIYLPKPPMAQAGTATAVSITFTLQTGDTQTLSTSQYRVDRFSTPGEIYPNYASTWPPHREDENSITVTWWGGYGANGSDVPQGIKNAMLLYIHELYEKRGNAEPPAAVKALLDAYKWGSYR